VKVVDKIEKLVLCSTIPPRENRALYERMWKNIIEPGSTHMTVWRMRIACRITKATNTHSQYVTIFAFPLQQWLHERASALGYTYVAWLICLCM